MGCLVLLILGFIFRGAIIGLLAWLVGAVVAVLTFLLNLDSGHYCYPRVMRYSGGARIGAELWSFCKIPT